MTKERAESKLPDLLKISKDLNGDEQIVMALEKAHILDMLINDLFIKDKRRGRYLKRECVRLLNDSSALRDPSAERSGKGSEAAGSYVAKMDQLEKIKDPKKEHKIASKTSKRGSGEYVKTKRTNGTNEKEKKKEPSKKKEDDILGELTLKKKSINRDVLTKFIQSIQNKYEEIDGDSIWEMVEKKFGSKADGKKPLVIDIILELQESSSELDSDDDTQMAHS